jgi:hypothetical protein
MNNRLEITKKLTHYVTFLVLSYLFSNIFLTPSPQTDSIYIIAARN